MFVYFVRCTHGGPIRIGTTFKLEARMKDYRMHCPYPVEMIACTQGSYHEERMLHRIFADSRAHDSWYEETPELMNLIKELGVDTSPHVSTRKYKVPKFDEDTALHQFIRKHL